MSFVIDVEDARVENGCVYAPVGHTSGRINQESVLSVAKARAIRAKPLQAREARKCAGQKVGRPFTEVNVSRIPLQEKSPSNPATKWPNCQL
jgi:hypothetical protein